MDSAPLAPPPDAARSFVAGRENPAAMGVRFRLAGDAVEAEWTVPPAFEGWGGLAHGVVAAALHDEAAINAIVNLAAETGFTRRLDVRYHRPIRVGDTVRVRAVLASSSERGGVVRSEVLLPDGSVASSADVEYAFVGASTVERLLGRPISPTLSAWFASDPEGRRRISRAWGAGAGAPDAPGEREPPGR